MGPSEIQHGQVQCCTWVSAVANNVYRLRAELTQQPCQEGPEGPGGLKAQCEPSVCTCRPEGQMYAGLHQKRGSQQGMTGDCSLLLCPCEARLEYWGPYHGKDLELFGWIRGGCKDPQKS